MGKTKSLNSQLSNNFHSSPCSLLSPWLVHRLKPIMSIVSQPVRFGSRPLANIGLKPENSAT